METGVSLNRWLLRDWDLFRIALAWIVCAVVVCLYWFVGWPPVWQPLHQPPPDNASHNQGAAARYLGSIIFVHGDKCWKRILDNRTGVLWDIGYIKCEIVVPAPIENPQGMGIRRIRAIGRALQHDQAGNTFPEQADSH